MEESDPLVEQLPCILHVRLHVVWMRMLLTFFFKILAAMDTVMDSLPQLVDVLLELLAIATLVSAGGRREQNKKKLLKEEQIRGH